MAKARKRSRQFTETLRDPKLARRLKPARGGRGRTTIGSHVRRITHARTGARVSRSAATTSHGRLRAGLILHHANGRKQLTAGGGGG